MSYEIVHGDITTMRVDAIVNAANRTLLGGGGLDGCIHRAAGPELLKECRTLNGCETGNAKITNAYNLPCKYVIHAVGPAWTDGHSGEAALLSSCYRRSLEIAAEYHLESIAFPLISAEFNGYPKQDALNTALQTVQEFLSQNDMHVYIVLSDQTPVPVNQRLRQQLEWFISHHLTEHFADSLTFSDRAPKRLAFLNKSASTVDVSCENLLDDIAARLNQVDESFSQSVLRLIDEKGLTDVQCYNRANIDRKLFSKIRSNVHYKPSKPTALALAVALKLDINETRELIGKAGYALSRSSKFDIIIEFFIENHHYDINEINEALYNYDQPTLGGC